MDRYEAREAIVEWFRKNNLLRMRNLIGIAWGTVIAVMWPSSRTCRISGM